MLLNELRIAVFQIILLTIIPVVCWLFATKGKVSLFKWIGLKRPVITDKADKKKFLISLFFAILTAVSMSLVLDPLLPGDIQLANARFGGQGINALLPAVIFSFFATALPEEILFRGFLGKRVFGKLGFFAGNTIQALLFGLLHGATLFPAFGIPIPMLIILFTGTLGWLMGYINSKTNDSIVPGWCLHGISNLYAAVIIMFELL